MASIDKLIKQSVNPFDNFASGNFWHEQQDKALTVESIHQEALTQIKSVLEQVTHDHNTRTLILYGDSGVGKTHFLGRLKQTLNSQAFFAYIEPFPQSEYIWRHILRYTVDSLVSAPDGQEDSQLMLWLKSCLSAIRNGLESDQVNLIEKIQNFLEKKSNYNFSERQKFIGILKKTFGTAGIYNANEFFGILYDLTNPNLYSLACEWLKGDNLDEDSLQQLRVGRAIDTENAARKLLANFSKISAKTQPIVLCFDQLDNIARLPDNSIDLPALFSANSTIHNEKWPGLLVIISIITSTLKQNYKRVPPADLARITSQVALKRITVDEAKALWATRLYPLHRQAQPKPNFPIYPLTEQSLQQEFPGSKALPRDVLRLGQHLIQMYKVGVDSNETDKLPPPPPPHRSFQLVWLDEFNKVQQKITRIRQFSSTELIRMLQEALSALQVSAIQPKLLPSPTYAAYSLSYQLPGKPGRIGVAWTEEPNMTTFCNVMKACHKVVEKNLCETLYLIRTEGVGKPGTMGNKIYTKIFTSSEHHRIEPDLTSVHYLATYHSLVNAACAGELVVGGKIINLPELKALIREAGMMRECLLFKELGIFPDANGRENENESKNLKSVKEFLLNLVDTNQILGRQTLIENAKQQFAQVKDSQFEQLIQELCQLNKILILDPNAKPEAQLICFVPNG